MYLALDANFAAASTIEQLGETHGPAGPMVVIALLGMAKQQGARGQVMTTRRKLAADAFLSDPDQAHAVVRDAVELGTLRGIALDDRAIQVEFVNWGEWQPRLSSAERAARARDRAGGS
jgi:hypothetical protein